MGRKLSVKAKVLAPLIGVFVLLEALAITGATVMAKEVATADAERDLDELSTRMAEQLNLTIEGYVLAVTLAAKALEAHELALALVPDAADRERLNASNVEPMLMGHSRVGFERLTLVDPHGKAVSTYAEGARVPDARKYAREPCFLAPQFTEGVYVSPAGTAPGEGGVPAESGAAGKSGMCFSLAYPTPDAGIGGVVLGVVNVTGLFRQTVATSGGVTANIYSVAHGPITGGSEAYPLAIEDFSELAPEFWDGGSVPIPVAVDGERYLAVGAIVRKFASAGASSDYWYVLATIPARDVGQAALRTAFGIAIGSAAVLAGVACVLWFVVERAMRPLAGLAAAAERVGQGRFDSKVDLHSGDELEDLGRSFNGMVDQLRLRDEELAAASRGLVQREKLAAIGTLAAGVAHEINNPLAFIKGNEQLADTILADVESDEAVSEHVRREIAEVRESLKVNTLGVERIERIVRSLRQFAKPSAAKETVPLRGIVDATLLLSQSRLKSSGIATLVELPESLPRVSVNPDEIGQVVLNLVVNAADAIGEKQGRISIRGYAAGDQVVLAVADDGSGIPEHLHEHIFTPFVTSKSSGTGLGLSISHRIVESHGGTLTFTTEPGVGTTFLMALPAATPFNSVEATA